MPKITSKLLDDIVRRLRKGESVKCPLCERGELEAVGDYRTTHCFRCNSCGERLLMDPVVNKE